MSNQAPWLSVVIPSFNEQRNLERGVLDLVYNYLCKQSYQWELILSDDGSTDGTLIELRSFADKDERIRLVANPHRGKGPTVKAGMLTARGKWRLFTDFDQSTPLPELENLLKYTDDYDIIIGSRELKGSLRDKEPFYRHLMGKGFNLLVQMLAVPGIWDTQCGFKLFSAKATTHLFPLLSIYGSEEIRTDAFTGAFDVELLYLARKYGFKIKEVPILWRHYETTRVNPVKDSWRMFKDIVRIRLASFLGKYPNKNAIGS